MKVSSLLNLEQRRITGGDLGASHSKVAFKTVSLPGILRLWEETTGDPEIRIAVLDGPVDLSHPCFAGAALKLGQPLTSPQGHIEASQHGTHVSSLIFGQHESSVPGVAPKCSGSILPVFRQASDGHLRPCSQQDLAQNISMAIEAGANIINISGGEKNPRGEAIDFLQNAVRQAADRNVLIIAAAGNDGCDCLHVPAALPNVLAVGALDLDGRPLGSSNWHDALNGIMAPGALIEGAIPGGGVGWMTGTSFATPIVTGVAALLMSLQKKLGLPIDASAVRQALVAGAAPCDFATKTDCRRLLKGTLDVEGSKRFILDSASGVSASAQTFESSVIPEQTTTFKGEDMKKNVDPGVLPQQADGPQATAPPSSAEAGAVEPSCLHNPAPGAAAAPQAAVEPAASASPPSTAESQVHASAIGTGAGLGLVAPVTHIPQQVSPSCQGLSLFDPFPPGQKAFPIGKLYYDFGTEARRDYFIAQIRSQYIEQGIGDIFNQGLVYNPDVMVRYLFNMDQTRDLNSEVILRGDSDSETTQKTDNTDTANALIWTLYIDQDPVYAMVPEDQYAVISFVRLANFLRDQTHSKDPETFRVAAAGTINGSITLFNGTVVPKLSLITRGIYDWDIKSLIAAMADGPNGTGNQVDEELRNFLLRVYDELRNLGVTSEERAKNFAATNAYQAKQAFVWAQSGGRDFKLDGITARRSPICRRNSDCWDISLTFFDPKSLFQTARQVFEYTIDVSDLIPVQVGDARIYPIYGGPNS